MATILVKIDIAKVFNQVIEYVNELHKYEKDEWDYKDRSVDLNLEKMESIDVKFQIISAHLEAIAKRAIELGDQVLIDRLMALAVITETKDQVAKEAEVPVK